MTTTLGLRPGVALFDGSRFCVAPFLGGPSTPARALDDGGDLHATKTFAGTAGASMALSDRVFGVGRLAVAEGGRTSNGIGLGMLPW